MSRYIESPQPELNNSKKTATYEIMHMEKVVATVSEKWSGEDHLRAVYALRYVL